MTTRAVVFALAGTATGVLLIIGAKGGQQDATTTANTPGEHLASLAGVTAGGKPAAGTYVVTGPVVATPFGPVQVQVDIANGKIGDVVALQTPTEHAFSVQLNKFAAPMLRTETLKAQDAKIDVVSGATYTSDAYAQSLQAALNTAATHTA
jgi:uncharacterized protein with FMN-binding domain